MFNSFNMFFWIIIGTAALLIDVFTSSFLFVWFTIGAIVAAVSEMFKISFMMQIILFIVISILTMLIGYPLVKKSIKKSGCEKLSVDKNYVGEEFTVDKDIDIESIVKFQGAFWRAENKGEFISKGNKVRIVAVKGNKLIIEKINK